MNLLSWLSPARWLLIAGLALSLTLGYFAWSEHQRDIGREEMRAQYSRQAAQENIKRNAVAQPITEQHERIVERIRTVTQTITKEVPVYVPSDSCSLPGGFRVLHDAAANGEVPDTARIPDAAAVPAQDVASTVAENYGACRETAQRLMDLQAWVRVQEAL